MYFQSQLDDWPVWKRVMRYFPEPIWLRAVLRDIDKGDLALRDHIEQQLRSVQEALTAADALERQRVASLEQWVKALLEGEVARAEVIHTSTQNELTEHKKDADRTFQELKQKIEASVTLHSYNIKHDELERRITALELWQSNVIGRYVGIAVVGGLFVAVVTAVAIHFITGN